MSKIKDLKELHNCETSEELLDISLPPDYQCGNIDAIIKSVGEIEKLSDYKQYDDEEELKSKLDDINWYIRSFEDELESLREAIAGVRDWGTEWKYKAKEMIERYDVNIEELN